MDKKSLFKQNQHNLKEKENLLNEKQSSESLNEKQDKILLNEKQSSESLNEKQDKIPFILQKEKVILKTKENKLNEMVRDYIDEDIKKSMGIEYTENFRFTFQGKILRYRSGGLKAFRLDEGRLFLARDKLNIFLDLKGFKIMGLNLMVFFRIFKVNDDRINFYIKSGLKGLAKQILIPKFPE